MLQVARLSPRQLGESCALVADFLRGEMNPDGGFRDRAGASDLYYTVFGLEGLIALGAELPAAQAATYLGRFGAGDDLDFVHLACLARARATLRIEPDEPVRRRMLERLESFRGADGGYAQAEAAAQGTLYASFLALGAYQDLGAKPPAPERLIDSLAALRCADGGYANQPGMAAGLTTSTAAAVTLLRNLGCEPDPRIGEWLLARRHPSGGFFAAANAPVPDLLSTATALHALSGLHADLRPIQQRCLDFVDTLWTSRGGFYGSWADDAVDCEYTYYALLALGHLSV
jgi:prenyltransferase beta subunit